jgi:ketosteroid isomerase-like protein
MKRFRNDVVWKTGGLVPDVAPVYEGPDGVRRFFEEFSEPWERILIEIKEVIDDREDQVVVLVRFFARGRDGIEVDWRFVQIYRYDERHLVREFLAFAEEHKEQALREAGLDV